MEKFRSQLSQVIVCSFDNRTHHLDEEEQYSMYALSIKRNTCLEIFI